jgi:hypothetical protein
MIYGNSELTHVYIVKKLIVCTCSRQGWCNHMYYYTLQCKIYVIRVQIILFLHVSAVPWSYKERKCEAVSNFKLGTRWAQSPSARRKSTMSAGIATWPTATHWLRHRGFRHVIVWEIYKLWNGAPSGRPGIKTVTVCMFYSRENRKGWMNPGVLHVVIPSALPWIWIRTVQFKSLVNCLISHDS